LSQLATLEAIKAARKNLRLEHWRCLSKKGEV